MSKILITGSKGTLGRYLTTSLADSLHTLIPTDRRTLNITKKDRVREYISQTKPDVVIHLAALTNVDECERHTKKALRVNTESTRNIADACKEANALLIFLSTSAIFSGDKKGYKETDPPAPANFYGKTKLMAEEYITRILKKHIIIRAGWMIGGGKKEKKFISYVINDIKAGKNISVVNDKFGSITYAKELADFIKSLIDTKGKHGIYHFTSQGYCSRYDLAKEIVKILKKSTKVIPVSSDSFKKVYFAPRPKYEVLLTNRDEKNPTWKKSLKNYIQNEFI